MKVKFKNCDGEFEQVIAKKIESHIDGTGDGEIKVILLMMIIFYCLEID